MSRKKKIEKPNAKMMSRQELLDRYAPLIKLVALRMIRRFPQQVELEDLINAGVMGLIDAASKFDAERDVKFETYAEFRIKGAILDELRSLDWVPRSLRQKFHELERAYDKLLKESNKIPSEEELAKEMRISLGELEEVIAQASCSVLMSLEDLGYTNEEGHSVVPSDLIKEPNAPDPISVLTTEETKQVLAEAVEQLPERERLVLSLYFYDELTMKEIGELLGVTESRVSQINSKAILHLRSKLKRHFEQAR